MAPAARDRSAHRLRSLAGLEHVVARPQRGQGDLLLQQRGRTRPARRLLKGAVCANSLFTECSRTKLYVSYGRNSRGRQMEWKPQDTVIIVHGCLPRPADGREAPGRCAKVDTSLTNTHRGCGARPAPHSSMSGFRQLPPQCTSKQETLLAHGSMSGANAIRAHGRELPRCLSARRFWLTRPASIRARKSAVRNGN